MKRFSILVLCAFVAAFVSCKGDETGDDGFRFEQPVVSEVSGTTAVVTCRVSRGAAALPTLKVGFAYGTQPEDPADYRMAENPQIEGSAIRYRLTGLKPDMEYEVFAYMDMGSMLLQSPAAAFVTQEIGADETVLSITSQASVVMPSAEDAGAIAYEVYNAGSGVVAEATCESTWVHLSASSKGKTTEDEEGRPVFAAEIPFTVDANTGNARTAVVVVSYPDAQSRQVVIAQEKSASDEPEESFKTIELNNYSGWPKNSYNATTVQLGDYKYNLNYVGDFGNGIQLKAGLGTIANAEDMGVIRKIELVYGGSTPDQNKNIKCYLGTSSNPTGNELEAVSVGGTYTFDFTSASAAAGATSTRADGYRYFKLLNGSGVSYLASIKIYTGGDGGVDPEPGIVEPEFGTPGCTNVSKNSATVNCSFKYGGTGSVTSVYFAYRASSGAEQQVAVSAEQGTKSVTLTGLNASTVYSAALCAVVDDKTYRSGSVTFVTNSESGDSPSITYRSGWPELPVETANSDYYYAHHICPDFKVNGMAARNFTVCYSAENHCPVWVSAPLHNCYVGGSGNRNYGPDPVIPRNIQPSSKSVGSPYNKGHMLGNRERSGTSGMNKQVSYYTNMAPQHGSTFNTGGGAWNKLEDYIDGQWCSDTLYMVTGCRFDTWTDTYGNTATPKRISFGGVQASVPTMFYYVLLRTKRGNTGKSVVECRADELQCVGFVMSHAMPKGHEPSRSDMRSVAEIEQLAGFTFFSNVPNAPKSTYNASDWGL